MILPRGFVEPTIINANSSPRGGSSGDHFALVILNDGHSSLLWNNMNGAYPSTIRNQVDDTDLKEFKDFILNHPFMFGFSLLGDLMQEKCSSSR